MQLFLEKIMSDVQAVLTILERRPPFLSTHSLYWACATIIKVILQVQSLYYKKKDSTDIVPYQILQKLWKTLFVKDIL